MKRKMHKNDGKTCERSPGTFDTSFDVPYENVIVDQFAKFEYFTRLT